jgi:hypothetical protein
MPGNYELLCLENPLLDIQGVGYVSFFPSELLMLLCGSREGVSLC